MAEPNIVKGQIALDPVNDLLYYVNEFGTIITTSLSWLKNDNNISTVENVVISGDLTVSGTTFTVNTETLLIEDNIIVLNSNYSGNAETDINAKNAGIEVERGSQPNVLIRWNESTNKWQFSNDGTLYYNILGEGNVNLILGTETTGDYVSNIVAGTGITITNNSGEAATPNISVTANTYDTYGAAATAATNAATALSNHVSDTTDIHGIADTSIVVTTTGTQTLTNKTITSPSGLVKGDVGLGNVDNTSDVNKPVSTATQTALDLKAPLASPTFTGTVGGVTKSMVGLGNVDNTSDEDKPVSTATQTALDLKASLASPTFTGTVSGVTKSMVGLGNVDNTSDANKPVSTATQTALDLKAPLASPTFTGTVTFPDNTVALGVKTTGDYVQNLTAGTGITLANNSGEGSSPTISIGQSVATGANVTFNVVTADLVGDVTGQVSDISNHSYVDEITSGDNIVVIPGVGIGPFPVEIATSADPNFSSVSSTILNVDGIEIDTTGATNGQVLKFDGTKFAPGTDATTTPGSLGSIDEHTDVTITLAANGQFLKYDGTATAWVNDTINLGTDTVGDYVASLVAGTGITLTNNSGVSATPTVAVTANTYDAYGAAATAATNAATALSNHVSDTTDIHGIADTSILVTTTGSQTLTNKTITSPSGLVKGDVGLDNVDNTSDANKPVSTATQTALDLKAPLASPTFTGTVTLPDGTITSEMIADGAIVNADINDSAAIGLGKLADATIDERSENYALVLADKNKFIKMNVATANTVTVPTNASNAFPIGSQIHIIQYGAGKTQVVPVSGTVVIYATPGAYLRAQYSSATLLKCDTDIWMLMGDLSAS